MNLQKSYNIYLNEIKTDMVQWKQEVDGLLQNFSAAEVKKHPLYLQLKEKTRYTDPPTLFLSDPDCKKRIAEIEILRELFFDDLKQRHFHHIYGMYLYPGFQEFEQRLRTLSVQNNHDFILIDNFLDTVLKRMFRDSSVKDDVKQDLAEAILNKSYFERKEPHEDPLFFFKKLYIDIKYLVKSQGRCNLNTLLMDKMFNFPDEGIYMHETVSDEPVSARPADEEISPFYLKLDSFCQFDFTDPLARDEAFFDILNLCPFGKKVDDETKIIALLIFSEVQLKNLSYDDFVDKFPYSQINTMIKRWQKINAGKVNMRSADFSENQNKINQNYRKVFSRYKIVLFIGLFRYHFKIKRIDLRLFTDFIKNHLSLKHDELFDLLIRKPFFTEDDVKYFEKKGKMNDFRLCLEYILTISNLQAHGKYTL